MPKRKKHPKLPSGWGSIRYLGTGRRNCYAVHPPATECYDNGHYIQPKAICYVNDWYVGFAVLNSWRAGTYKPGDEIELSKMQIVDTSILDGIIERILKDANMTSFIEKKETGKTFTDVYNDFFEWKYGKHASKKLSESSKANTVAAFKQFSALHNMQFADIRIDHMQKILNESTLGESSVSSMVTFIKQLFKYAEARELCDKDYARHLVKPQKKENESGIPFTEKDLEILWGNKDNEIVEMILIMCYSGFRITAYKEMEEINLEEKYFKGGIKTKSGKGRYVPIHSAIYPLVVRRLNRDKSILKTTIFTFERKMPTTLSALGIEKHTPHDCRHTFSYLCEKYRVNENDRKRMLGHSFGSDITNQIYGHRTVEELRAEIEKIEVTQFVTICDE